MQQNYDLSLNSILKACDHIVILSSGFCPDSFNFKIMKRNLTAIILILNLIMTAQAQTSAPVVEKTYQAWITTYDAPNLQNIGVLYEVNDSTVTLAGCSETRRGPGGMPGMNKFNVRPVNSSTVPPQKPGMKKFDVESIDVLKIRKNGNVGMGVLYGALARYE